MAAVCSQRQVIDPTHRRKGEWPIEMRKQSAAARRLPLQRGAERTGVDGKQDQTILAGAMLGRGRLDLGRGGEVDEAVGAVLGGAIVTTAVLRLGPFVLAADMEDDGVLHGRQGSGTTAA